MGSAERPLSDRQREVLDLVARDYEARGEPVAASFVARKLDISRQRVTDYFRTLNDLGFLRSSGSPAVPARKWFDRDPLRKTQLGGGQGARHSARVSTAAQPLVVDLPPLDFRAAIVPASINDEQRTVDLVWTTGAAVERFDWYTGKRYIEKLSLDPKAVRLSRLNAGGPLLDSHNDYTVEDQLGAVVPDSVTLTKNEGRARVRFSRREAVEPIWQDVKDGIIRSVSVGYRVYRFEEAEGDGNKVPVRTAIDWEPFELSMVPIPADAGAKTRSGQKPADTNPCEIVAAAAAATDGARKMNEGQSETIVQPTPFAPPPPPTPPAAPTPEEAAAIRETERCQGILLACRATRMTQAYADALIADRTVSLEQAQKRVLAELAKRGGDDRGPAPGPQGRVEVVGDDPLVHVRAGIENAILNRVYPNWSLRDKFGNETKGGFELTEQGRQYRGMNLMRIAEAYLQARGVRTSMMSSMDIAGLALGIGGIQQRTGFHTTSDFPILLADVARKTLRAAYAEAPQTFSLIARRVTIADFKQTNRVQIGDAPALLEVGEHGEFQRGTVVEGKEVVQLKTYGRIFAITRQALINDDTDAFSRMAAGFGRQARALESDLAWQQITSNPTMGDGNALFSVAHGNLTGTGTAIDVTSLGIARASMRVQKGIDGSTPLNVNPRYLIVPAAKETLAAQYLTQITPALGGSVNPFAGLLTAIVEPRLDVNSAVSWYMAADPSDVDVIELATLEGADGGPMVETEIGFEVDGLQIKARHDVAAKVIDWRGLYKNNGA